MDEYEKLYRKFQYVNNDSVVYYANKGLQFFTGQGYAPGRAKMLMILGNKESSKGNIPNSKKLLLEALSIHEMYGDARGIASVSNSLGITEGRTGNYKEAMQYFFRALSLFEKEKDTSGIVSTYTKVGVVYELTDDLPRASEYYDKAIALANNDELWDDVATLCNNKGIVYCKLDSMKQAIPYFEQAIAISKREKLPQVRILPLTNLGKVYALLHQEKLALAYYEQALEVTPASRPEDRIRIAVSMANLQAGKYPDQALRLLSENLDSARRIGHKQLQIEILQALTGIHKKTGDYKEALATYEQEDKLRDSLYEIDKLKQIANLQAVYDLEKSGKALYIANRENQWHKRMQLAAMGIALVLAVFLVVLYLSYRKSKILLQKISAHEAELAKANADKDRIFSIIGHDLKEPISNIPVVLGFLKGAKVSQEERDFMLSTIIERTSAASDVLDKLLNWGKSQIKGISQEKSVFSPFDIASTNIQLLQASIDAKHLTVNNSIDKTLKAIADTDNVSFIIRNLLANAIKFSYENGIIDLSATEYPKKGYVVISVRDYGMGMTEEQCKTIFDLSNISKNGTAKEKGNSIGLMLCKEFVDKSQGMIWVNSEIGAGSMFNFTIPMVATSLPAEII